MCYPKPASCIEFLMDFCTYDDIVDVIWITNKKLLQFKPSKSGQIFHVYKTGFPRPGHIYVIVVISIYTLKRWRLIIILMTVR